MEDILPICLRLNRAHLSKKDSAADHDSSSDMLRDIVEPDIEEERSPDDDASIEPSEEDKSPMQKEKSSNSSDSSELSRPSKDLASSPLFGSPSAMDSDNFGSGILGRVSGQEVRIDFQYPKLLAIFGQIGSGKSYLAGVLAEMAAKRLPGLNFIPAHESAVVIFNYRQSREARFEYSSFSQENDSASEVAALNEIYSATPSAFSQECLQVCAYSREVKARQDTDYAGMSSYPLLFRTADLEDEAWMHLMGMPDTDSIYIQVMRNLIEDLGYQGNLSLDDIRIAVDSSRDLDDRQKSLATLRLEFASRYVDEERGLDWNTLIRPGTITVIDLRRRQGLPQDALRLCLVVIQMIRNLSRDFYKFIVFDEFHEYYHPMFNESLDRAARMARHQQWNLCLATQNTHRVDPNLLRLFSNKFIFQVDSVTWRELETADERLRGYGREIATLRREQGECLALLDECTNERYAGVPIHLNVRPRATKHAGTSTATS